MHQKRTCGAMQSNMYWNNMAAEYSNIIVVTTIVSVIIFNAGFFYIMYKKGRRSRVISFKFAVS